MKTALILGLVWVTGTSVGFGQVSGGAGAGRGGSVYQQPTYGVNPAQLERDKRRAVTAAETKDDGTSTFVDASVLMNVKPDEYVAVFGVVQEAKTISEANTNMDETLSRFKESLKGLKVSEPDIFVDFVVQNRVYAYAVEGNVVREELAGFELKKNVSIRYKDRALLDQLVRAAAAHGIYDLIKVDYVVKDTAALQATLRAEAARILKTKAERYQSLLGAKLPGPPQMLVDSPSIYYPNDQYSSYTAAEAERIEISRSNRDVVNARKSRTFYFSPLDANGFDTVINPVILEPVVQFTIYVKVKYAVAKRR